MKKILIVILPYILLANPSGEKVIKGIATFERDSSKLIINQATDKAIIEWKQFSIDPQEETFFNFSSDGAVLNRVIGSDLSKIYGSLRSNGKVFLINENGIIVGPSGIIDVSFGFIASSLNVKNNSFLKDKVLKFTTTKDGKIINLGRVFSSSGDIVILAKEIENEGLIKATQGGVYLGAATEILYAEASNPRIAIRNKSCGSITNKGAIESAFSEIKASGGNVYSLAVNQGGVIEAAGIVNEKGRLILEGDTLKISGINRAEEVDIYGDLIEIDGSKLDVGTGKIEINARKELKILPRSYLKASGGDIYLHGDTIYLDGVNIDASGEIGGGAVLIGGDYRGQDPSFGNAQSTFISPSCLIRADATILGDGGKVIVWSEEQTSFQGEITAKGGIQGGDGGFVEVSSRKILESPIGKVDTSASSGKMGQFLIDPSNIEIKNAISVPPAPPPFPGGLYNPGVFPVSAPLNTTLNVSDIVTTLNTTNVIVLTSNAAIADGTITVTDPILWSTANSLTLQADYSIYVNANIVNTYFNLASPLNSPVIILRATDTSTIADHDGIHINSGVTVQTNEGGILIDGVGRGASKNGVLVDTNAIIDVLSCEGDIVINGKNLNATTTGGVGVRTATNSFIKAATTSIDGRVNYGRGVLIENSIVGACAGDVDIYGEATLAVAPGASTAIKITNSRIESPLGDINFEAKGDSLLGIDGFDISATISSIVNATIGNIKIKADTFFKDANSNLEARQSLILQPFTDLLPIGLGTGSGIYDISDTKLNDFSEFVSSVIIGDETAQHDVTVGTGVGPTYSVDRTLTLIGKNIMVEDPLALASSSNLTLRSGIPGGGTLTLNNDISATNITLNGDAGNDVFKIFVFPTLSLVSGTLILNGLGGINRIEGPDTSGIIWEISGTYSGNMRYPGKVYPLAFQNIMRLVGGAGDDTFNFQNLGGIDTIDGGAGTNTLGYSLYSSSVTVDLQSSSGTGISSFSNIQNLSGSSNLDTLIGPSGDHDWYLTADNAGSIGGTSYSFTSFENLTGAGENDSFIFSDGVSFLGLIDGGGGFNILDYTAYTSPVEVVRITPTSGHASNLGLGFENIQGIIGAVSSTDFPIFPCVARARLAMSELQRGDHYLMCPWGVFGLVGSPWDIFDYSYYRDRKLNLFHQLLPCYLENKPILEE